MKMRSAIGLLSLLAVLTASCEEKVEYVDHALEIDLVSCLGAAEGGVASTCRQRITREVLASPTNGCLLVAVGGEGTVGCITCPFAGRMTGLIWDWLKPFPQPGGRTARRDVSLCAIWREFAV